MAQMPASNSPVPDPVTPEAFYADRQNFWTSFCSFTTFSAIGVVVLLLLMLIFLR